MGLLWTLGWILVQMLGGIVVLMILVPYSLALISLWYRRKDNTSLFCTGRVWHARLQPLRHAFTYPIFYFGVDLLSIAPPVPWPLSLIAKFDERHHLKDRPGDGFLSERIFALFQSSTFQPTAQTHTLTLLTHLSYYGYCFNPVSFYLLHNRTTHQLEALVGEVSNTPWNEMHCYLLHGDIVKTSVTDNQVHYTFPKTFHVSPFMEMNYDYHWVFDRRMQPKMTIINEMKRQDQVCFRARLSLQTHPVHPLHVARYLALYPAFCAVVQVWIHMQAFFLFAKGVAFQPHPAGTETFASRIIGNMMVPLYALQAWWEKKDE